LFNVLGTAKKKHFPDLHPLNADGVASKCNSNYGARLQPQLESLEFFNDIYLDLLLNSAFLRTMVAP
jgi:hypothetical protein